MEWALWLSAVRAHSLPRKLAVARLPNIILRPRGYQKYRYLAQIEPLIVVEGVLGKKQGTVITNARDSHQEHGILTLVIGDRR